MPCNTWTAEELAEMQKADMEIEKEFESNPKAAIRRTYYLRHRKERLEYQHRYTATHKEHKAEYDRLYREKKKKPSNVLQYERRQSLESLLTPSL